MNKNNDVTFLTTYFAEPNFLRIHTDSIDKFHPGIHRIISQQSGDDSPVVGTFDKVLSHDMQTKTWAYVCEKLVEECETDIGVFLEHDVFLLKPLDELFELIRSGKYDMIGPEEVIPGLRYSPGVICQNFFILNVKKFKEIGGNVHVREIEERKRKGYQIESGHGVSQSVDNKLFLPVSPSGYAHGTFYGDYVHHFWWGSYPGRNVAFDGIEVAWLESEAKDLVEDYENNNLRFYR